LNEHNIYVAFDNINVVLWFIETQTGRAMKYSEFRRWLKRQGVELTPHRSGSSHYRATLGDKTTIFPDHGSKEIGKGLVETIKKELGLK
jgi:mRNA interferase HicA